MTKSKAIKLFCFDCAGESNKEVTLCTAFDCQLWPFRFGNTPATSGYRSRMMAAATNYSEDFDEMLADGIETPRFFQFGTRKAVSVAQTEARAALGMARRGLAPKKGPNSATTAQKEI